MSKDNALYPNYVGNPQKLDPAYVEGDDTVAGATDYNKHDDEILKHQDVINNTIFHTINTVDGTNITAESSLTTLNLRTGAGISIIGNNTTKTITISSGEAHAHDALSKLDYASSNHTGFQAILTTGAGISIVNNVITGTSDQNLFKTIDVEGINLIADSLETTLNFRTGAGISFSTDSNTKTFTINGFGNESDPLSWSKTSDQTLLTGDKSGSFNLSTTGELDMTGGDTCVADPIRACNATNMNWVNTRISEAVPAVQLYYLNNVASSITGYKQMTVTNDVAQTKLSTTITGTNTTVDEWATNATIPGITSVAPGLYKIPLFLSLTLVAGKKDVVVNISLWHRTTGGTETQLGVSSIDTANINEEILLYSPEIVITTAVPVAATDRLVIKITATQSGSGGNPELNLYYGSTVTPSGFVFFIPASAVISDAAYGASWNGSLSLAPSQNAIYDALIPYTGATTDVNLGSHNFLTTGTITTDALILKQGANGKCGTFVCNEATPVTVSNTSIAITDCIVISLNTVGGTVGALPHLATITAATGFTVVGTAGDISTYNYAIISNAV